MNNQRGKFSPVLRHLQMQRLVLAVELVAALADRNDEDFKMKTAEIANVQLALAAVSEVRQEAPEDLR